MSDIRKNLTHGLFWTAIDKYSGQLIGILISMVLARLLTPYDYGVVATATVFLGFLSVFTSVGIGPAVIQNKGLTQDDLDSIFSFSAVIGIICGLVAFGSSWLIADFYHNEILKPVMQILSIGLFLGAINMVPSALMSKHLRFKEMAVRNLLFQILFGLVGIIAAFYGLGVYALIIPPIATSFCMFFYNNHFYPVKFRLKFSIDSIKKIFSFSSYLFLFEIFTYFSRNIDKIIIGKYISEQALGYYEKSYRLMQLPLSTVTSVVYPVLQPVLSELQDDKAELGRKYSKIVSFIACIGFPFGALLGCCSAQIITVMFGNQWIPAIPVFRILAISVPFMLITNPTGAVFLASNSSKRLFYTGIINTTVTISGFIIAALIYGTIESIAWAWTITLMMNTVNSYFQLYHKALGQSLLPIIKSLAMPMICGCICVLFLYLYDSVDLKLPEFFNLVFKLTAGGMIALIFYNFTGVLKFRDVYTFVKNKFKKSATT